MQIADVPPRENGPGKGLDTGDAAPRDLKEGAKSSGGPEGDPCQAGQWGHDENQGPTA